MEEQREKQAAAITNPAARIFKMYSQVDRPVTLSLTPVFSVERQPQADASLLSFVAGIQPAHSGLQAPYTGSSMGEISLKPLSLQASGVGRRLEANSGGPINSSGGQPNLSGQTTYAYVFHDFTHEIRAALTANGIRTTEFFLSILVVGFKPHILYDAAYIAVHIDQVQPLGAIPSLVSEKICTGGEH
jgi:hypothetical protein